MNMILLSLMLASSADRMAYAVELCDKQPSLCRFTRQALADGKVTRSEHQRLQIEYGWVRKMREGADLVRGKRSLDVTPVSPKRDELFVPR